MKREALGMIETRGLVPAIEAADAGVKAANVRLVGYEIVKGGLVMVAFVGEVAAVSASVDAGAAAGEKVGQVISTHVIPRPEADLRMVFTGKKAVEPENDPEPDPPGNGNRKKMSGTGTGANQCSEDIKETEEPGRKESPSDPDGSGDNGQDESTGDDHEKIGEAQLKTMTVGALRRLARRTPGISLRGREISRANKEELIREITRAQKG